MADVTMPIAAAVLLVLLALVPLLPDSAIAGFWTLAIPVLVALGLAAAVLPPALAMLLAAIVVALATQRHFRSRA